MVRECDGRYIVSNIQADVDADNLVDGADDMELDVYKGPINIHRQEYGEENRDRVTVGQIKQSLKNIKAATVRK